MTKLFCDNCGAALEEGISHSAEQVTTRLKPSNIEIRFNVIMSEIESDGSPTRMDACMNCFLTALHGAFKQPEVTA